MSEDQKEVSPEVLATHRKICAHLDAIRSLMPQPNQITMIVRYEKEHGENGYAITTTEDDLERVFVEVLVAQSRAEVLKDPTQELIQ